MDVPTSFSPQRGYVPRGGFPELVRTDQCRERHWNREAEYRLPLGLGASEREANVSSICAGGMRRVAHTRGTHGV